MITPRIAYRLLGLLFIGCFLIPSTAKADGGTIRLSERHGPYQITVFTSPTPLRAGLVDVSVLVMDCTSGQPIQDAEVTVRATDLDGRVESLVVPASSEAATNKLLQAAVFELPAAGVWRLEVGVQAQLGQAQVQFNADIAAPLPQWVSLWPWIGWPGPVIILFGVHQWLVRRRLRILARKWIALPIAAQPQSS
jgi:hypothetical protein